MRKKIVAIATTLTMAAMAAGPGVVGGVDIGDMTLAELQELLESIQDRISDLGGGGGVGVSCNFTRNLYPGMSGSDVKCLQQYLNDAGNTLASSGPGSPGNETEYYGSLTQAAVGEWQDDNGVAYGAYRGYFGPVSQAKYDALAAAGEEEEEEEEEDGRAGTYTVLIDEPANAIYTAGSTERDVYGYSVKALGSNIKISRTDLQVAVTNVAGAITYSPSSFITGIKVYCDGNLVKTIDSPAFNLDSASRYFVQVAGFSCVVPKDATKVIKFAFETTGSIDNNRVLTANVYGNGVLGTDGLGVNTFTALATVRTFTFQAPGNATLTAALTSDTPITNYWYSDPLTGVTNLPMLRFTLTATGGDATLTRFALQTASGTASTILPSVMRLYDGDTIVPGGSSTTGLTSDFVTFENISLSIPSGTTKTLTAKADYAATTNTQFAQVAIPLTSANCSFTQSNGTTANVTVGAANLNGANQYMQATGVKFSLVSAPTPTYTPQSATSGSPSIYRGSVTFTVTPFGATYGRTLYASTTAATNTGQDVVYIEAYRTDTGAAIAASGVNVGIVRDVTTDLTTDPQINEAETITATETITYNHSTAGAIGGFNVRFRVIAFEGATVGGAYEYLGQYPTAATARNTLLDKYVTPSVYITPTF